jgi:hypothetical protein
MGREVKKLGYNSRLLFKASQMAFEFANAQGARTQVISQKT